MGIMVYSFLRVMQDFCIINRSAWSGLRFVSAGWYWGGGGVDSGSSLVYDGFEHSCFKIFKEPPRRLRLALLALLPVATSAAALLQKLFLRRRLLCCHYCYHYSFRYHCYTTTTITTLFCFLQCDRVTDWKLPAQGQTALGGRSVNESNNRN